MVRQRLIIILIIMAITLAMPTIAMADTVYEDGNISTTFITIFRDICPKFSMFDNYVFFRSGQYDYTMYVGDISLSGTDFIGSDCKVYYINSSSSYNSNYTYSVGYGSFR